MGHFFYMEKFNDTPMLSCTTPNRALVHVKPPLKIWLCHILRGTRYIIPVLSCHTPYFQIATQLLSVTRKKKWIIGRKAQTILPYHQHDKIGGVTFWASPTKRLGLSLAKLPSQWANSWKLALSTSVVELSISVIVFVEMNMSHYFQNVIQ